jgi:ABC-2 type transport system permease protein
MKQVMHLAIKDLRILLRTKTALFWIGVFPLLMALFFGAIFSGGGGGMRSMRIAVVDEDKSDFSASFIDQLKSLDPLDVAVMRRDSASQLVRQGKKTAYVALRPGFGQTKGLFGDSASIEVGIDPSRQAESGYLQGLLNQATFIQLQKSMFSPQGARQELQKLEKGEGIWGQLNPGQRQTAGRFFSSAADFLGLADSVGVTGKDSSKKSAPLMSAKIDVVSIADDAVRPRTAFEIYFPSGVLWALLGCAASFGISIVKERTGGTFMRLRLAPIGRAHILAGKGLACFIACVTVCTVLLAIGNLIFGVRITNPLALVVGVVCSALAYVGVMMFISVLGKTEEAVAGAGWGILLVLSMLGGGMVPAMFMPQWLRTIGSISPVRWGILSIEGGIWRNFSPSEMLLPAGILLLIGVIGFSIGVTILAKMDR